MYNCTSKLNKLLSIINASLAVLYVNGDWYKHFIYRLAFLQEAPNGPVIPVKHLSNNNLWLWQEGISLQTSEAVYQVAKVPPSPPSSALDSAPDSLWSPPKLRRHDSSAVQVDAAGKSL